MTAHYSIQNTVAFIGDKQYPPRYVSLVLGNPRSEECAGFGICRLDEDWPLPGQMPPPPPKPTKPKRPKDVSSCGSNCCSGVALIERLDTEAGKVSLSFSFLKSALTSQAVKKHFGTTHFIVGNDLLLPTRLTEAFDIDPSVLSAGLYEIVETKSYFTIQLPIN